MLRYLDIKEVIVSPCPHDKIPTVSVSGRQRGCEYPVTAAVSGCFTYPHIGAINATQWLTSGLRPRTHAAAIGKKRFALISVVSPEVWIQ